MKQFLKNLYLIFPLFCGNIIAGNYTPGYIITQDWDTIQGELLIQNSKWSSLRCVFKRSGESQSRTYSATELIGYRYQGSRNYYTKEFLTGEGRKLKVFMEILIEGLVSIYYYVDDIGEHYFIEKEPYGLIELSEFDRVQNGLEIRPSIFRGKLQSLIGDCKDLQQEINKAELNYKSLIPLAHQYHNKMCNNDSCIVFERKIEPIRIDIGLFGGVAFNQFVFGTEFITNYGKSYQLGSRIRMKNVVFSNPSIDFDLDACFEVTNRYILRSQDKPNSIYYNGIYYYLNEFNDNPGPGYVSASHVNAELEILNFKLPFLISYSFGNSIFDMHIGGGFSNIFILNCNRELKELRFEAQYAKTFRPYYVGLIFRGGMEFKIDRQRMFISLSYENYIDPNAVNKLLRLEGREFAFQLGAFL